MIVGEEPNSYGYGGTGRFSTNNKFSCYGESFGKGDVIMALMDLDSKPPTLSYCKNGTWLGVACRMQRHPVGDDSLALFPHILSKNCRYILSLTITCYQ